MNDRASQNFCYSEFVVSREHPDLAREIELSDCEKIKVFYLSNILEVIRSKCNNLPTRILSGKRSPRLNAEVNGALESDHLYYNERCAADFEFYWDNYFLWNAFYYIDKLFPHSFGQAILYLDANNFEIPRFCHLSLPSERHISERLITIDSVYHTIETAIEQYPDLERFLRIQPNI